ncbi:thioredoxin family protein [Paenibacillus amylolyticus]|uniref:thioredoxin family protein n=1 Tax=Paenibacillus amylolyticus TaxID=1451 RepID=UPI003EBEB385
MNLTLYYSNDCGHCRRLQKTLDKIAQERQKVDISRIEYDPSIHTEVKFIPTVVVSYEERELGRFSSALTKKTIDAWLDQLEEYIKFYLG